jgi:hypothetical protein
VTAQDKSPGASAKWQELAGARETVSASIKKLEADGLLWIEPVCGSANVYWLDPPVGSFESIRQIWLTAKWLELQPGGLTAIQVRCE